MTNFRSIIALLIVVSLAGTGYFLYRSPKGQQVAADLSEEAQEINEGGLINQINPLTIESLKAGEYPSGGHNINGASFSVAMQRTVDFYKKHL